MFKMNCNFPSDFYEYESNFSDYNNAEINENIQEMITEMNNRKVNWIKLSLANHISIIRLNNKGEFVDEIPENYNKFFIDENLKILGF